MFFKFPKIRKEEPTEKVEEVKEIKVEEIKVKEPKTEELKPVTLQDLYLEIQRQKTEIIVNRFILGALFLIGVLYAHFEITNVKDIVGVLIEIFMS